MKTLLWQERKSNGWTQEYVAEQIGISPEAVSMLESGQRKPSYDVLVKLEDLFQVNHRKLFAVAVPVAEETSGDSQANQ